MHVAQRTREAVARAIKAQIAGSTRLSINLHDKTDRSLVEYIEIFTAENRETSACCAPSD
jgi:hypothetical protein